MSQLFILFATGLGLLGLCAAVSHPGNARVSSRLDMNASSKKADIDSQGFEYNPILCTYAGQCRCKFTPQGTLGGARCSRCPNDKGSSHKNENVCWCKDFTHNSGDNECNPDKVGGPARDSQRSFDNTGTEYRPFRCTRPSQCLCRGIGDAQCSRCPDDKGSKYKNENVCWCKGVMPTKRGSLQGEGHREGNECSPIKPNGPMRNPREMRR